MTPADRTEDFATYTEAQLMAVFAATAFLNIRRRK